MPTPNILLIVTDQHRYDAIGVHGNPTIRTPHLDELARTGTDFTSNYTVCTLCTPARASLLTGAYPHDHGLLTNSDMINAVRAELFDWARGFGEPLAHAGWNCGYVGKWHVGQERLPRDFGFEGMNIPGYGHLPNVAEYREYLRERGLEAPQVVSRVGATGNAGTLSGPVEATEPYFLAEYTNEMLGRYSAARRRDGSPFLLWLNFWGPHAPYVCPEPYASMYDPASIEPWPSFEEDESEKPMCYRRMVPMEPNAPPVIPWSDWSQMIAKYWGRTTLIDEQIGRILARLDELGEADNTIVIFTSDHGDTLGVHNGKTDKGPFAYEDTYHTSLIVRDPTSPDAPSTRSDVTSIIDIASTVLDYASIDPLPDMRGRSLRPLLRSSGEVEWRDAVVTEWHGHQFLYSQRMLRHANWKYVFNPTDLDELYDLDADPNELTNLAARSEHAATLERLQRLLMTHLVEEDDPLRFAASFLLPGGREYDQRALMKAPFLLPPEER
ncbi:MAG: sulfatase-like hydrolase/transferase [Spirochaetota bacterium]